jgi:hypothetical protein
MAKPSKPQKHPLRTDLTSERLRELMIYEPETGLFRWRISRRKSSAGTIAGTSWPPPHDYVIIGVDRARWLAHRLAWLYMTGKWSKVDIDHINGNRSDNRWINLREATRSQNVGNSKLSSANRSGFKGVHFDKSRGKWMASIAIDGFQFNLGRYTKIEDAIEAYRFAAETRFDLKNPPDEKET